MFKLKRGFLRDNIDHLFKFLSRSSRHSHLATMSRRSARLSLSKSLIEDETSSPNPATIAPEYSTKASKKRETSVRKRTSSTAVEETSSEFVVPATPNSKRRRTAKESTKTKATASSDADAKPTVGRSPSKVASRPADPHATNAPLSTPRGSRVVAYSNTTPVKWSGPIPTPTTTTDNLLEEACKHLISVDERLKPIIEKHHCQIFSPEGLREVIDPFRALVSSIIGQQVSGAAAGSIRNKFIAMYPTDQPSKDYFPAPLAVAETSLEKLRTAGLSQRKAEYIQGLAQKFTTGELTAQMLVAASDEEVMEKLVAVRGLGKWSVEMFACFALKRMDVFSTGDLGVQRGMAALVGKDVNKLRNKGGKWKYMTEQEMLDLSAKFAPYRSLFMWYMWRVEDVNIEVLDNM